MPRAKLAHCEDLTKRTRTRVLQYKLRGISFWGPYNKDPTMLGAILGYEYLGSCSRVFLRHRSKETILFNTDPNMLT